MTKEQFYFQTDALRWCLKKTRGSRRKAFELYAEIEASGFVSRRNNTRGIDGEQYARLLYDTMDRYGTLGHPIRSSVPKGVEKFK